MRCRAKGAFPVRGSRDGAAEALQALAAVTVMIGCVGVVLAAVNGASLQAAEDASRGRAELQGEMVLDALLRDPALVGSTGAVHWAKVLRIADGRAQVSFVPEVVGILSIRSVLGGDEVLLHGSGWDVSGSLVYVVRPVVIDLGAGVFEPGVARAGVRLQS